MTYFKELLLPVFHNIPQNKKQTQKTKQKQTNKQTKQKQTNKKQQTQTNKKTKQNQTKTATTTNAWIKQNYYFNDNRFSKSS